MKNGFTLIELLVVVTIAGLLTAGAIWNIAFSRRISAVGRAADEIALKVREVQSKALVAETSEGVVPCGFGIHWRDENGFIIFAETPEGGEEECLLNDTQQNIDRRYGGFGIEEDLENFLLTERNYVKINNIFEDIYFEPPDAVTYINGERDPLNQYSEIIVCLRSNCSRYRKSVKVYLGGRIEID